MANEFAGRRAQYGVGIEATRGTAAATADVWLERTDGHIDDVVNVDQVEMGTGKLTKFGYSAPVQSHAEGSLSGLVENTEIGFILNGVFGDAPTPSDTPQSGTVYDHAFTCAQTTDEHQSLTVWEKTDVATKSYTLAMVETFEMTFSRDELPRYSVSFKSKVGATDTDTVSYTDGLNYFKPANFSFYIEDDQSDFGGATRVPIQQATISVAKDLVVEFDQGVPRLIMPGSFTVTGSIDLLYNADTYRDIVFNNTDKALRFALVDTNTTIGSASNPQMIWDVYLARFESWTRNMSFAELAGQTLNFHTNYDKGNSEDVTCTLRNLRDTAYDA